MPHKLAILSRSVAAIAGGYVFASVLSIWLVRALPAPQAEAVMIGLLSSFLVYSFAVIWAFSVRTATRAWIGLVLPIVVFGGWAWALGRAVS